MHWLWVLIIGAIIGAIAGGAITSKGKSMGWISNIIAGLVGSAIGGEAILGSWGGPQLAGMAIIPSIIGAVILVWLVSFILSRGK
nr:GlsB/YeaQ/YmgE family stress response membrane protein [Liquorilactobacillus satsumensis]